MSGPEERWENNKLWAEEKSIEESDEMTNEEIYDERSDEKYSKNR